MSLNQVVNKFQWLWLATGRFALSALSLPLLRLALLSLFVLPGETQGTPGTFADKEVWQAGHTQRNNL
jgi:hypothetical protein